MAGLQDLLCFCEDFLGPQTILGSPVGSDKWDVAITGAGPPTATCGGVNGELTLAHSADTQVQNICLYQSDILNFDIDYVKNIEFRVKMGQATLDATSMFSFGLCSARNDAIDSLAAHASFRLINADTEVYVETDDGTTDLDDKASGVALGTTYKKFVINFSHGLSDVRFFIGDRQVAKQTTFDMSAYSAGLQPYLQLQKTSDVNADSAVCDYIKIESDRH